MLTLDAIRKALQDRNLKKVSKITGVGYSTIYRIANKKEHNPSYETVRALSAYLTKNP